MQIWKSLLLFFGLVLLMILPAHAQEQARIGLLEIALWPEYDQPSMLVIYRLTLSASTALPAQLSLRIPATAGRPNAVAVREPSGQLVNLEYEINSDGTWSTISLVANFPELQIEYYDPRLYFNGAQRNFTYEWIGDYAVDSCYVEVQQPLGASDMSISPGPVSSQVAEGGLNYFTKEVGRLDKGQSFKIEIAYQKNNNELSVSQLTVQPVEPLAAETGWGDRMVGALPYIIGVAGVALIAGGFIWYWQSGRQILPAKRRRGRASRKTTRAVETPAAEAGSVYCHQCGRRAADGDRFCRSCGTRLRVE